MDVGMCLHACTWVYILICSTLWSSGIQVGAASLGTSDWTPTGFGPVPGKGTGKVRLSLKFRGA